MIQTNPRLYKEQPAFGGFFKSVIPHCILHISNLNFNMFIPNVLYETYIYARTHPPFHFFENLLREQNLGWGCILTTDTRERKKIETSVINPKRLLTFGNKVSIIIM